MSTFITRADYLVNVTDHRLDQIIEETDAILDNAEDTAISVIKDALSSKYDTDGIFQASGIGRHPSVMLWVKRIVMYYIYERIPDDLVPERIIKNYNETMDHLDAISDGGRSVDLPLKIDDEGAEIINTKRRWGSQEARSH